MFTATFLISFGIKKGNLSAYSSLLYSNFSNKMRLIVSKYNESLNNNNLLISLSLSSLYRFQFTSITSRSTTYLLFTF
jgi:hypothetical protein